MTDNVIWIGELDGRTTATVGRRAQSLDRMVREGVPVPPGFVLSSSAFHAFLAHKGVGKRIAALLAGVDPADRTAVADVSRRILAEVANAQMPRSCAATIKGAYDQLSYGKELSQIPRSSKKLVMNRNLSYVAVRTSRPDADGGRSLLNVKGEEDLIQAVKRCWASLFEPPLIPIQVTEPALNMAVVIQKMVAPEVAGRVRSRAASEPERLEVRAVAGLGSYLDMEGVAGDRYLLDRTSLEVVSRTLEHQRQKFVRDEVSERLERSGRVNITAAKAKAQKLPDQLATEIAGLARRLEGVFDGPVDVSWAAYRGKLAILGARKLPEDEVVPTMTVPAPAPPAEAMAAESAAAGLAALAMATEPGPLEVTPAPRDIAPAPPPAAGTVPTGTFLVQLLEDGMTPAPWADSVLVRTREALDALLRSGVAGREVLMAVEVHEPSVHGEAVRKALAGLAEASGVTVVLQGARTLDDIGTAVDALEEMASDAGIWVELATPASLWLAEDLGTVGADGVLIDGETLFPALVPGAGREAVETSGSVLNALAYVGDACRANGLFATLLWATHSPTLLGSVVASGIGALVHVGSDAGALQTTLARVEMRYVLDHLSGGLV